MYFRKFLSKLNNYPFMHLLSSTKLYPRLPHKPFDPLPPQVYPPTMFLINKTPNTITELKHRTFSELGFRERDHLQEWIAKNPMCLGEELLIIQKEFSGFDDTRERLDLLALDKEGNLVIIENKLDDSGRDVVWQSLKYASYCSSLTKEHIKKIYQDYLPSDESAEDLLTDFFEQDYEDLNLNPGYGQRLILVAAKFRKEVTSTVMWLLNHGIRTQCFRVTPFSHDENLYLNVEQIIPIKDAEDFMISMAEKAHEEQENKVVLQGRHKLRREFWTKFLDRIHGMDTDLFKGVNAPSRDVWMSTGSGVSGVHYVVRCTGKYAQLELNINRGSKEINNEYFTELYSQREHLEEIFGSPFVWENSDKLKSARLYFKKPANIFDHDDWEASLEFLCTNIIKFSKSLHESLHEIHRKGRIIDGGES
jgi:Domain of unknown function (DUF4268)